MISRLIFIGLLIACCTPRYAQGQIGESAFSYPAIGVDSIGQSSSPGLSDLPHCRPRSVSCSQAFTYTFIGSGNWTIETNWDGNVIPPASLPEGAMIVIDPVSGGECVLNTVQTILSNASLIVRAGKKLKLLSHLLIQQ